MQQTGGLRKRLFSAAYNLIDCLEKMVHVFIIPKINEARKCEPHIQFIG